MQHPPKVSIVLPTYNGQQYLVLAIGSCLLQTFEDLELIIVDDASTDSSCDIISAFDDPRIRYIRHDRNRKLSAALNTGFAASRGEYLTWIADDNLFDPSAIQKMVDFLDQNPGSDIVYAGYYVIDGDGIIKDRSIVEPPEKMQYYNVVGACFLYRRRVYELVGDYNEDLVYLQDNEYWVRVSKQCKMAPLDEVIYYYRMHKNTQTREYRRKYGRYQLDIDAAKLLTGTARRYQLSWLYVKSAKFHYIKNEPWKSIKFLMMAIYTQPSRLLTWHNIVEHMKKTPRFVRRML